MNLTYKHTKGVFIYACVTPIVNKGVDIRRCRAFSVSDFAINDIAVWNI